MKLAKLYPAAGEPGAGKTIVAPPRIDYEPLGEMEIMVRGMDRETALDDVSRFLDRAVLTGLSEVKIIHGFGEQILARAIKDARSRDPRVLSWRNAAPPTKAAWALHLQRCARAYGFLRRRRAARRARGMVGSYAHD